MIPFAIYKVSLVIRNADYLFTYIRDLKIVGIETFYVENLRVVFNHGDPYRYPTQGLRYWHDGRYWFSVLCNDFGMGRAGSLPIPDDIIKIDIGITAEESIARLKKVATICETRTMKDMFSNEVIEEVVPFPHPMFFSI